jgi:hypothetical protein
LKSSFGKKEKVEYSRKLVRSGKVWCNVCTDITYIGAGYIPEFLVLSEFCSTEVSVHAECGERSKGRARLTRKMKLIESGDKMRGKAK